ncbi:hypothetical protein Lal_00039729 [Lupinus albus]|nr:hypothetical protein Lal_00039729 [Lupinus albus]
MDIYRITSTWMYQEDYRTTVDLDLSDEETLAEQQEQPKTPPEAPEASQRLNQRVDAGLQALNDNVESRLMNFYDRVAADIQRENDQTRGEIDRIVSPGREWLTWVSEILSYTEGFSLEREDPRLSESVLA